MWTRWLLVAIASTIAPVPSGEASSTTSTPRHGFGARIAGISRAMLNRSLKVGTMTSARSANAPPIAPEPPCQHHQPYQNCNPGNDLAALVCRTRELQRDSPRSRGKLHSDHRVIDSADVRALPIYSRQPAGIVVLGDYERRSGWCGRTERDVDLPRLIRSYVSRERQRFGERLDSL